ncbi:MAG: hypothetical protein ACREMZ_11660 [Gemmatimonadales bacterium]
MLTGCRDSTGPGPGPGLDCTDANTQNLAVGELRILDPVQDGACARLSAPVSAETEHLYLPVGTEGQESADGVSAPYQMTGSSPAIAAAPAMRSPLLSAFRAPLRADEFHGMLRGRERALSQSAAVAFSQGRVATALAPPPVVGHQDTFKVCSTSACDEFVDAAATAKAVGSKVAVYVDDAAPADGYTDPDLVDVAALFDDHLYPIDTAAFGSESDIDGNGVVIVLLTHRVNALSPNCNTTGSVILGYFFGADLLPRSASGNPGSNEAEIFYGLVPDPANSECDISLQFALSRLPATFIHEFQHMISFNQHRLVRGGSSEDTWLNEGLSHFAEELGARQVPDAECPSGSCADDFLSEGNLPNAFAYLESPEEFFLIEPGNSTGQLEERGANWLFVRWLADHFAADTVLGTDLTRRLVATSLLGSENVSAQTGTAFSILVPEWQATNYLDDLSGFNQPSARLRYKTWNFRQVAASNSLPYPLVPDVTSGAGYNHVGVLRAGSGRHVLVVQPAGSGFVDLQFQGAPGEPFPSVVEPRIALIRIR